MQASHLFNFLLYFDILSCVHSNSQTTDRQTVRRRKISHSVSIIWCGFITYGIIYRNIPSLYRCNRHFIILKWAYAIRYQRDACHGSSTCKVSTFKASKILLNNYIPFDILLPYIWDFYARSKEVQGRRKWRKSGRRLCIRFAFTTHFISTMTKLNI